MCGIFAMTGVSENAIDITLRHLKKLEYRGYDSSGIGALAQDKIVVSKNVGATDQLAIQSLPSKTNTTISHVRWATHGNVTSLNAHPHSLDHCAIVHNGIIENHQDLIQQYGLEPKTETDSEVILLLYNHFRNTESDPIATLQQVTQLLTGSWAIVLMDTAHPQALFFAVNKSPLVLGVGSTGYFIASDPHALRGLATQVNYLEDHTVNAVYANQTPPETLKQWHPLPTETFNQTLTMDYYLQQEIYEQPIVLNNTLETKIPALAKPNQIVLVASGSSYHTALLAAQHFEAVVDLPCRVFLSSELKQARIAWQTNTALIALSQSGETADTIEAVKRWKNSAFYVLSICNVNESSLSRLSQYSIITPAGQEVSVGATKTVVSAYLALLKVADYWSDQTPAHDYLSMIANTKLALTNHAAIKKVIQPFIDSQSLYVLGKNTFYPVAMEFALKVKELCYIHAEAFSSGELKHGPLALIEAGSKVICLAFKHFEIKKVISNIEEIRTRGGDILVITDTPLPELSHSLQVLTLPFEVSIYDVPGVLCILQLFALELAIARKINPDRPRNLAKCVTVE